MKPLRDPAKANEKDYSKDGPRYQDTGVSENKLSLIMNSR